MTMQPRALPLAVLAISESMRAMCPFACRVLVPMSAARTHAPRCIERTARLLQPTILPGPAPAPRWYVRNELTAVIQFKKYRVMRHRYSPFQ